MLARARVVAVLTLAALSFVAKAQTIEDGVRLAYANILTRAQDSVAKTGERYGQESGEMIPALESLGNAFALLKRNEEAENTYRRAIKLAGTVYGPDNAVAMNETERLATFYSRAGKLDQAEATYDIVLKDYAARYGESEQSVVRSLNGIGRIHLWRHDFKTAKRYFDRVAAIVGKAPMPDVDEGLSALWSIETMYRLERDEKGILQINERVLESVARWQGGLSRWACQARLEAAGSYEYVGRYAEAEKLIDLIPPDCMDPWGGMPVLEGRRRTLRLADIAVGLGESNKAEHGYYATVISYQVAGALDLLEPGIDAQISLAAFYRAKGGDDAATKIEQQAAVQERHLGADWISTLAYRRDELGRLYFRRGKPALAESLFTAALASLEKAGASPDVKNNIYPQVVGDLADLYANSGDYAKAEPLYRQELESIVRSFGPDDIQAEHATASLASICEKSGRKEEAGRLNDSLARIRERRI